MKSLWTLLFLFIIFAASALDWSASYRSARKKAIREKKQLFICFTGSDWCTEGNVLKQQLSGHAGFQQFAGKKYILYNADLPKNTKLGQEAEEYNRRLASRYSITVFPAIVVIEPKYGSLITKQVGFKNMKIQDLLKKLEGSGGK